MWSLLVHLIIENKILKYHESKKAKKNNEVFVVKFIVGETSLKPLAVYLFIKFYRNICFLNFFYFSYFKLNFLKGLQNNT